MQDEDARSALVDRAFCVDGSGGIGRRWDCRRSRRRRAGVGCVQRADGL